MRLAVMQPYFFPYLGYFQLLDAADRFVFYDDVNYIKNGWINRNRVRLRDRAVYLTVPTRGGSSFRRIEEVAVSLDSARWRRKLTALVKDCYACAPCFPEVFPLFAAIIEREFSDVGALAKASVRVVAEHLGLDVSLVDSSRVYGNAALKGEQRVIDICRREGAQEYLNAPGGRALYSSVNFERAGLRLRFLRPRLVPYPQQGSGFLPGLSILDVLMNNPAERARELVRGYEVE